MTTGQVIHRHVMERLKEGNGVMKTEVNVKDPAVENGARMANQVQLLCHSLHQLQILCHPVLKVRQLLGKKLSFTVYPIVCNKFNS